MDGPERTSSLTPEPFGRYFLLDRLAVGGFADIHRGVRFHDGGFQSHVVIKRIRDHLSADPSFQRRFLEEARITELLQHPNIVKVTDFEQVGGIYYIAFEYVAGRDVRQILRGLAHAQTHLPVDLAASIALEAATGLAYAHGRTDLFGKPLEIVHRDISPSNLLVSWDGLVKIADFGIARCKQGLDETPDGVVIGKFDYMSPEQSSGDPSMVVDAKSDLFSLGVLLHEALTGRRLFHADDPMETARNVRMMPVAAPSKLRPEIPSRLDAIALRLLARDPSERFQSAQDVVFELADFLAPASTDSLRQALGEYVRLHFARDLEFERATLERWTRRARGLWEQPAPKGSELEWEPGPTHSGTLAPASPWRDLGEWFRKNPWVPVAATLGIAALTAVAGGSALALRDWQAGPAMATVAYSLSPAANVIIDGQELADHQTFFRGQVTADEDHWVVIEAEGFDSKEFPLKLSAADQRPELWAIILEPTPAKPVLPKTAPVTTGPVTTQKATEDRATQDKAAGNDPEPRPVATKGTVTLVNKHPVRARVRIDESTQTLAPDQSKVISLSEGLHTIHAEADSAMGRMVYETQFRVTAGQAQTLSIEMVVQPK